MENEKFQELVIEQFVKLLEEIQGLKGGSKELLENQLRLEAKLDLQVTALHDFRVSQEKIAQDGKDDLENTQKDVNYAIRKLTYHNEDLGKLKKEAHEDVNIDVIEKLDRIERKVEVLQLEATHLRRSK